MAFGRKKKLKEKWRVRGREIYLECDGDIAACEKRFREKYGSLAAILLILEILLALWKYWQSKSISSPSYSAMIDEPIDWIPDAEDDAD